ncbi:MAG TPA: hypothetical protein VEO91_08765 [Candidatus Limnocylindria bacterium]|jgi:hypothetical protein|nr:hypothetical protein [Candidatus Limnocylindria bacterium]
MLSLELGRLVHEERQKEIEERLRTRLLLTPLEPDRPRPGEARPHARLVDEPMLARRGVLGSR